jgi:PAS domain S-box-containing protein
MMREMGGRITFWHGGAERLYGYPAKDALGRISHDLLRTEFSRPLAEIEAELRADGFWQGELTQKRRDGAEVIVASQWVLHRDRMLDADVVIEVNTDITALKRAEEEVRDKEILLEAVLDALPVGVIIADAEGRIVRDNTASRELWGVPPETTSWAEYSNWVGWWPGSGKEIKAEEWAMTRALLRGEITRGELVECQQFGSGERSVFLNNAAPVRDTAGRILGAVAAVMDVTEARRAELVNQELLATLDLAAAFIRDEGGIIRFWSAGCERLYGWTAKEAIGRAAHGASAHELPGAVRRDRGGASANR